MSKKAELYAKSLRDNQEMPYDSTYSIVKAIYNQIGGNETNFDSTYSIVLAILEGLENGTISPGSSVSISDLLATGSLIANLTIDDVNYPIYIPAGAAGSGSFVTFTQIQSSGSKIAEIGIDGVSTDIYAPEVDLSEYATTASVNSVSSSFSTSLTNLSESVSSSYLSLKGGVLSDPNADANLYLRSSDQVSEITISPEGETDGGIGMSWIGLSGSQGSVQFYSNGEITNDEAYLSLPTSSGVIALQSEIPDVTILSGSAWQTWNFTLTDSSSVSLSVLVR